ncbi:hypothetical protein M9Y10_033154 [Tritrichomonas musculus]|uniref:NADP-dependent oxidoreductase domain-containing protein n=1 Tax=Tritrichomonas musculus TaxID=1915356 RepID=A0ABR2GXC6_9EUKA
MQMQYVTLSNGIKMRQLGYDALKVGYRLIDTAQAYQNEEEVGNAIIKSGIPRKDIFITTKVAFQNFGYEKTKESVLESLRKLQTDYIDLILLHQPFNDYYGAWKALEELYDQGKLKSIGLSNFSPDRMIDLYVYSRIKPMVNQVELHPYNQQIESQKWMQQYNVITEAWAPFAQGRNNIFVDPIISSISQKYNKSAAKVVLRWEIQRGIVVIPKSVHIDRMKQNFEIFDFILTDDDMSSIIQLDENKPLFRNQQDPTDAKWFVEVVGKKKK